MKTISNPEGKKKQLYAKLQEAARKDVERAFGVLQSRFAIIRNPCRLWDCDTIALVWKACVVLHNMIVEDERDCQELNQDYLDGATLSFARSGRTDPVTLHQMAQLASREYRCDKKYFELRNDLIEHMWSEYGN